MAEKGGFEPPMRV